MSPSKRVEPCYPKANDKPHLLQGRYGISSVSKITYSCWVILHHSMERPVAQNSQREGSTRWDFDRTPLLTQGMCYLSYFMTEYWTNHLCSPCFRCYLCQQYAGCVLHISPVNDRLGKSLRSRTTWVILWKNLCVFTPQLTSLVALRYQMLRLAGIVFLRKLMFYFTWMPYSALVVTRPIL